MKLTIQNKLFMSFGIVLIVVALVSINNFVKLGTLSSAEHRLVNLRLPTVMTGVQLTDGIHLSLAGLRGYMILGDNPEAAEKFKAERQLGWDIIDQAVQEMNTFSESWTDPNNIKKLNEMKGLVEEFRVAQQQVEDVSHTPDNIASFTLLLTEATPRASSILEAITTLIDEESTLDATSERKDLLKLLADSRGSFAVGLANIRAFLLSGDNQFAENFNEKWKLNEIRFNQISDISGLFNSTQLKAWNTYKKLRKEFSPLPPKMFEMRNGEDWNLANYWLGTKAAPKAKAIMNILEEMRISQDKLAEMDQELLDSETLAMEAVIVSGALIALLVGIIVSIYISRMISVPLKRVVTRARAIASGDLTGAALTLKGNDELTELTGAINDMSNNLKEIVQQITGSAQHIGSSAEELSAITEQTSQSIFEQQSQTEQAATAMNEMSATVQEVSRNIVGTAQSADEANTETTEGRRVVNDAISGVKQLAAQVENAAEVIHQLEQDSENISAVMEVIRGIAEQTNLLALNAAIEAARAGEQGRGFAVVADEVRTLAGRTQDSTAEITQVIEKLQAGSRKAVEVMYKSSEEARMVVEQASKAGTSLSAISAAVERINDMSTQIASAAEEQSATTEEINRNITGISEMAGETSTGAQQTATASGDLARLGAELQEIVGQFRI